MTMLKLLACVWLLGAMPCANAGDLIKVEASPEAPMDVSECCANNGASGCKTTVACAPGHQMCPPGRFGDHGPQFHVRDASCTINDPNGPIYDPVHGVYHLHYQDHVGLHGGRTWGHAVSKDLAHWAHLPISIWNDQPYDSNTIASGSGTVVNGKIIQVYPGICNKTQQGCPNSANLCIAVPADPADPLQTNWSKTWVQNPLPGRVGGWDPSSAWQTSFGEWRLTTQGACVGSMDFKTWYPIGRTPGFPHGEDPSFFPLPRTTPGAKVAPSDPKPTHVHKISVPGARGDKGGDHMRVGTYIEGHAKTAGNFTATPGIAAGLNGTKIDKGPFYGSKDFYDPVKKRRINWGWASRAGAISLPREITWNPELQQLVYSPLEEQDKLRQAKIGGFSGALKSDAPSSLGLPKHVGTQSEIMVSFSRPTADATIGVKVMVSGAAGTLFTIAYKHGASSVAVGGGGVSDTLKLTDSDETLDMRLYVDNTFTEVYYQGGRVAMTVNTRASADADVTLSSSVDGVTATATAWSVSSIWVAPEEVLRAPRLDGKSPHAWKTLARLAGTPDWEGG